MEQNENKLNEQLGFYLATFYPILISGFKICWTIFPNLSGLVGLLPYAIAIAFAFIFLFPFGFNPNLFSHIVVMGIWIFAIIYTVYPLDDTIRSFGKDLATAEEPIAEFLSDTWLILFYLALVIVGILCIKTFVLDIKDYFKQKTP